MEGKFFLPPAKLAEEAESCFRQSGRRHFLITGSRGAGKTTLFRILAQARGCGGVVTYATRTEDGLAERVILESLLDPTCRTVAARRSGTEGLTVVPEGFSGLGVRLLSDGLAAPGEWIAVDEIGFLETQVPIYLEILRKCFSQRRILAVLRKQDLPFLLELRENPDCFVVDLDLLSQE